MSDGFFLYNSASGRVGKGGWGGVGEGLGEGLGRGLGRVEEGLGKGLVFYTSIGGRTKRATTNVQKSICPVLFIILFFSFVLLELNPLFLREKSWGKILKKCEKV